MGAQSSTLFPSRNPSAAAGAFPFNDRRQLAVTDGGDDMWHEELEPAAAAAEVAALAGSRPASPPADEWRRDRAPPTPMAVEKAAPAFATAREVQTRRWARMRAEPANMAHVPPELYPNILVHASVSSLARLALCSKAWSRAVADAVRTEQQWCAIFKEHESIPSLRGGQTPSDVRERAKHFDVFFTSVHQLFGALFCQCDGPAACVAMLQAMEEAADNDEAASTACTCFCEFTMDWKGPHAFGMQLAKCPRSSEWTAELFLSCYLAASNRGDCVGVVFLDEADRITFELRNLVLRMRRKTSAFSVTVEQVQALILKDPKMITTIAGRSYFIMQSYACFYDEYEFNATMATTMGSAVAEMGLPIEQVIDLISKLDEHEGEAEAEGWSATRFRNATAACLTAWATDADFPSSFAPGDIHKFLTAFRRWSNKLKKKIAPIVIRKVVPMLAPVMHFLGDGDDDSPDLIMALEMIGTMAGSM